MLILKNNGNPTILQIGDILMLSQYGVMKVMRNGIELTFGTEKTVGNEEIEIFDPKENISSHKASLITGLEFLCGIKLRATAGNNYPFTCFEVTHTGTFKIEPELVLDDNNRCHGDG